MQDSNSNIRTVWSLATSLSLLGFVVACSQQKPVEIVDNSTVVYGRLGATRSGEPIARYSANNPARQSGEIAYKYNNLEPQRYDVDAPIDKMAVKELPPPAANIAATASAVPANAPITSVPNALPFKPASPPLVKQSTAKPAQLEIKTPIIDEKPVIAKPAELDRGDKISAAKTANDTSPVALQWPVAGNIISRFGPKTNGLSNDGVNIEAKAGEPIWASADGEVIYVGNDLNGYGNLMIVRHADGWLSSYAHAQEFLLAKGTKVKQGDLLGYVGSTGSVKSPQLHFSLRQGKIPVDPETAIAHSEK